MTEDEMKKQMYQAPKPPIGYIEREKQLSQVKLEDLAAHYDALTVQMGLPLEQTVWREWMRPNLLDRVLRLEANLGRVHINRCARCDAALLIREYSYKDQVFCDVCHALVAYVHLNAMLDRDLHPEGMRLCTDFTRTPRATTDIPIPLSGNWDAVTCNYCLDEIRRTREDEENRIQRERAYLLRKERKALKTENMKKMSSKPTRMERREELWAMPIAQFIGIAVGHSAVRLGSWLGIVKKLQEQSLDKDETKRLKGAVRELLHIEPLPHIIEQMVNYETSCAYLEDVDFVCRVCATKVYGHASRTRPSKMLISRELFLAFARHRLCVVCATKAMMSKAVAEVFSVYLDKALEDGELQPKGDG